MYRARYTQHAICEGGCCDTLTANDFKDPGIVAYCAEIERTMKVINMIPYGTRLGFHEDGVASTVARIDYKFPQCVCYENSECVVGGYSP